MTFIARVHVSDPIRIRRTGNVTGSNNKFIYIDQRKEWMEGDEKGKAYWIQHYKAVVVSSNILKYFL
ncbi:MAG: hypothetical protein KDH96_03670 [Candidatus Riesia sp.]|nr:hypothetical protein [Candidatus Riesia sp.]